MTCVINEFHAMADHTNTTIASIVKKYLGKEINANECGAELYRLYDRFDVKSALPAYDLLIGYTALQQLSRKQINEALEKAGVESSPLKAWDDK